jgi:hypothetical protein
MQRYFDGIFRSALRESIAGPLVTATPYRFYERAKYTTVVELTYKGKTWEGDGDGRWVGQELASSTFSASSAVPALMKRS